MKRKYGEKFEMEINPALNKGEMPTLKNILNFYDNNEIIKYAITPVGSTIGFLIAKQSIPDLNENLLNNL